MSLEQQQPPDPDKKIHKTHFPVVKIPLKDNGHESGYEWKDLGNGHSIRVPKKTPPPHEHSQQG